MNEITIGAKILNERKAKGLSQSEFAELLCISKQAVGKWERGESLPDIIMLGRIAEIIQKDLNYFGEDKEKTELSKDECAQEKLSWNMSMSEWKNADFSGLKNAAEKIGYANIKNCKFLGADLSGIVFRGNNIVRDDFLQTDFKGSQFFTSNIAGSNFSQAMFYNCKASYSNFVGNNFSDANFTKAVFKASSFCDNNFVGTIWDKTEFSKCSIAKTEFCGQIKDCSFVECSFRKTTFRNAQLKNVFFKGRNIKKVAFINCTADKMSYEFLKNAKAELSGVLLVE